MKGQQGEFKVWDYLVFFATLAFSALIGVFFAVKDRKQKSEGNYLMAGRGLSVLPVAISTTVSFMSAISILGTPAEMYTQGAMFMLNAIGTSLGAMLAGFVFVPLLYPLQLTSSFEYLERRFNSRGVRLLGTYISIVSQVVYMGTATFAPATAFYAVTGFPVWATIIIMGVVSTFYTSLGGMKAVIWTDVFQCGVMLTGILAVIIKGTMNVGSVNAVFNINDKWGRLDVFNFGVDPTIRQTFWALTIGSSINFLGMLGLNQSAVQRYSALPTLRKARIATALNMFGVAFFHVTCSLCGLVIFAYYATQDCDPLGKELIENSNQLMPFFVMETLAYPCIPGLFVSALFSGALSSISSSLNALAAVTWEDILKPKLDTKLSKTNKLLVIKATVVIYGAISLAVSFIVKNMEGTVIQITLSLLGALTGPIVGLFILGAIFPWANYKGAITGALTALIVCSWISVSAYMVGLTKDDFPYPTGDCSQYMGNDTSPVSSSSSFTHLTTLAVTNSTNGPTLSTVGPTISTVGVSGSSHTPERSGLENLYALSYLWYALFGSIITNVVGLIVSFITGANKIGDVPPEYLVPIASRVLCCLPKSWQTSLNCHQTFEEPEDIYFRSIGLEKTNMNKEVVTPTTNGKAGKDNLAFTPSEKNGQVLTQL